LLLNSVFFRLLAESLLEILLMRTDLIILAACALRLIPIGVLRASVNAWSWQGFAGAGAQRDPALLFSSMLPDLFTPELDWLSPSAPVWIRAVGYLWLIAAVTACVTAIVTLRRGNLP